MLSTKPPSTTMARSSSNDSLRIRLTHDLATLQEADGTEVMLPRDLLSRSYLLTQAVSDALDENDVTLSMPEGVIQAWLGGLKVLGVHRELLDAEGERAQKMLKTSSRKSFASLLESLMAADFLDDRAASSGLCVKTSNHMFATYIDAGNNLADEHVKEFSELPGNLQQAVLATCQVPLLLQLQLLPEALHHAALHAAHPSLDASSSISVPFDWDSAQYCSAVFWQELGKHTSLRSFSCERTKCTMFPRAENYRTNLTQCVAKFQSLESLTLSGININAAAAVNLLQSLSCTSSLQQLDISNNYIGFESDLLEALANALATFTSLRSLNLSGNPLSCAFFKHLAPLSSALTKLHSLNVNVCKLGPAGTVALGSLISSLTALTDLRCYRIEGSVELIRCIANCTGLQHLELPDVLPDERIPEDTNLPPRMPSERYRGPGCLHLAAPIIATLTRLQVLRMPFHEVTDQEMHAVAQHMTTLKSLRILEVAVYSITTEGAPAMRRFLSNLSCLEDLTVNTVDLGVLALWADGVSGQVRNLGPFPHNIAPAAAAQPRVYINGLSFPGQQGVGGLRRIAQHLPNLQTLSFAHAWLGGIPADELACQLSQLRALTDLNLGGTGLDRRDIERLAEPIGLLTSLQSLSLVGNEFTGGDLTALARQFQNLKCLRGLILTWLNMSGRDSQAWTQHLSCLACLQRLCLQSCSLGEEGVTAIAPDLANLGALQELDLSRNAATSNAIEALVAHITKLRKLAVLDLQGNDVCERWMPVLERFARVMPCLECIGLALPNKWGGLYKSVGLLQFMGSRMSQRVPGNARWLATYCAVKETRPYLGLLISPSNEVAFLEHKRW